MIVVIILVIAAGVCCGALHFLLIRRVQACLEVRHPELLAELSRGGPSDAGGVISFARGRRGREIADPELSRLSRYVQLTWRLLFALWALAIGLMIVGAQRNWY